MLALLFQPFRRMFDFKGRARRSEFALCLLLQLVILGTALVVTMQLPDAEAGVAAMAIFFLVHMAVFALPVTALQVRRMHDQDKSGWWVLVALVPYLGVGMILFFMFCPGTWGANRFGPDPRHSWDGDLFE